MINLLHQSLSVVQRVGLLCLLLSPINSAGAAEQIFARSTTGVIREISLEAREAIISGYRYYFGHTQYNNSAEIKLYQSDAGAFELLSVGMKVEIVYAEYGHLRYVLRLQQLADDTLNVER